MSSPADGERLEYIVIRSAEGTRELRASVHVSPENGVAGDRWRTLCWLTLPDGSPDPRVQVSLMNARILRLIAGDEDRKTAAEQRYYEVTPQRRLIMGAMYFSLIGLLVWGMSVTLRQIIR